MAEQIPYGVAASLIDRLASAAFREFGRIYGVMDELDRLKNTVESIKAVLLDAEGKQEQNHAIQNWIRRLKDVLHPADDLLDEFIIEDMRHKLDAHHKNKVAEVFHSLSPNRITFRHKMAHQIEKTRTKFNNVLEEMSKLNLSPNVVVTKQIESVRRETGSFVLESDIIGREDSKKKIISLLMQPDKSQNVSSVAIVGIGGLGKTALAQLVYNDREVQDFFQKRMWVCISDNFDVKIILKKMLVSLISNNDDGTKLDKLSLDNLQSKLRENLNGKRYLLVLDDIWNESHQKWTQLRTYLMCGAQGSKVLVTTRSVIVAQTMGVSDPYLLKGLTPEESWSLLNKIITFGNDAKGVNRTLESIGWKITEKCKGIPLAIRTLGGLLQNESEESEWINVLQGDFWKLCEDENSIMPVLKVSYQNLSPQLRQCFAYCALFPKDCKISKDDLIQLWMAQGYLECSNEKQLMEDVGNQYVKIFLMKSFFQDAELMDEGGDVYRFKMHDLMHDLATLVAGDDCCYLDGEKKRHVERPMHVTLDCNAVDLLDSLDASRLRTLILWSSESFNQKQLKEKELAVVSNFKYLRALKLFDASLSKLSRSIGKLKHLRYLELWNCEVEGNLSQSISNLVCLQTLKLSVDKKVELSTKVASKLTSLRRISIDNWYALKDKTAGIYGKLILWQYHGVVFSNGLSSLKNIVQISLHRVGYLWYLPPLERLPFLKSLHIYTFYDLKYMYYEEPLLPEAFFPSLESLTFVNCSELKGWRRMRDDFSDDDTYSSQSHNLFLLPPFPRLSQLSICSCPELTCMPTFPNLDKRLELTSSRVETLKATLYNPRLPDVDSYRLSLLPLSILKSLEISEMRTSFGEIPKNWMRNLTSLEHLVIEEHYYPQEIRYWFEVEDNVNYLPSLQKIDLRYCQGLEKLPDWICNLSSLRHIRILRCRTLEQLPEGMPRLTKLQTLEIIGCPLLSEECKTQTSSTWPKIAHIPNIILKYSP